MHKLLQHLGQYLILMQRVISKPKKWDVFRKQLILELEKVGLNSVGIVVIISFFVGGVVSIQTAINLENPLLPSYIIGLASRDSLILEFSPTMISLILAGKIGSSIASEIGTMRVTEQIDALEVMGINTLNYLIFPKIVALLLYPFLITFAMFLGIIGGYIVSIYGGFSTSYDFIQGIQLDFRVYHLFYAYVKTTLFAFILATVPSYHGYYMKGGALDVGKASTLSFVWTSVVIIIVNYIVTQLLLA